MITNEQLKKMNINEQWLDSLNNGLKKYNIDDKKEIAMFLSQCSHESKNFTRLEESFKYSAERLLEVFKSRIISIEKARGLLKQGDKAVANFLYNGRMENRYGSDDGYNYRGRGIIQLTGRQNYRIYADKLNIDLLDYPDFAIDVNNAVEIALTYWKDNNCSKYAKLEDCKTVTKIINGGSNGLHEREELYKKYWDIING